MKYRGLIVALLVAAAAFGCRILPEPTTLYNEEIVLRVWDSFDARYGSEIFFECEYLPVLEGRINIVKPYGISDVVVATCSPPTGDVKFFQPVESNPGPDEVVVAGTTLRFNAFHEGQNLFVAWIPHASATNVSKRKQENLSRK